MEPPDSSAASSSTAAAASASSSATSSSTAAAASASSYVSDDAGGDPELFYDAPDSLPPPPLDPEITPTTPPAPTGALDDDATSSLTSKSTPQPVLRRRKSSIRLTPASGGPPNPNTEPKRVRIAPTPDDASTGSTVTADPPAEPPRGLLVYLAGLVVKAIFFQISLLVKSSCFPIWLLYWSFSFISDPLATFRRWRDGVLVRVTSIVGSQGRVAARVAWGCLWVAYVSCVLVGLLVTAFFGGSLVMGRVVEEPVRMTAGLNFDYTKASPDAVVPLPPCEGVVCGVDCGAKGGVWGGGSWRPVPEKHKLQLTVSLTLPESEYNQKLGVFQVRAEFLSAKGRVTSSASQPCMLRFRSSHIRFIESFIKSATLLAGFFSESQILRLKLKGFTEGTEPTVCIRVILEQRAEYRPAAGIPEIYAASLKLESELPLFKRIIWNWRKTLFVWISMALFMWELFVVLLCCRPVIIPAARRSGTPTR